MKKVPNPVQPSPECRPWCMSRAATPPLNCGGECLAEGTWVAATRGAAMLTDDAVKLARVEACATLNERGEVAVNLSIHGPISPDECRAAWAYLSPAEARTLAQALLAEADLVELAE